MDPEERKINRSLEEPETRKQTPALTAAVPATPGRLRRLASRRNLITAGIVVGALGAGLVIGLQFAGKDGASEASQQSFSSRSKTSNATNGDSAQSGTTAGTSGNSASGSSQSTANTTQTTGSSALAPSGGGSTTTNSNVSTTEVDIDKDGFSPLRITVKKGTRITWTNNDSAIHALDRAEGSELGPHSQQLGPGETYTYSYSKAGTYKYICVVHPAISGTVIVTD